MVPRRGHGCDCSVMTAGQFTLAPVPEIVQAGPTQPGIMGPRIYYLTNPRALNPLASSRAPSISPALNFDCLSGPPDNCDRLVRFFTGPQIRLCRALSLACGTKCADTSTAFVGLSRNRRRGFMAIPADEHQRDSNQNAPPAAVQRTCEISGPRKNSLDPAYPSGALL